MAEVLSSFPIGKKPAQYRFRYNLFRQPVLQLGSQLQDWDTNSGHNVGPEYMYWRDATIHEAEIFIREYEDQSTAMSNTSRFDDLIDAINRDNAELCADVINGIIDDFDFGKDDSEAMDFKNNIALCLEDNHGW